MKIQRVALAAFAFVALFGAASAPAAYDTFRTKITLYKPQKTADGKLLKAGQYDLQINFSGVGNQAEFVFLQNGNVVGRQQGEAHGFPAQAPKAVGDATDNKKYIKMNDAGDKKYIKMNDADKTTFKYDSSDIKGEIKGESPAEAKIGIKGDVAGSEFSIKPTKNKDIKGEAKIIVPIEDKWVQPAGGAHAFSWGAAGFGPNASPKTSQAPGGGLVIAIDSANSAAGFKTNLLPYTEKK